MDRQFDIPIFYRSSIISQVKRSREMQDPKKRDLSPTVLDFGPVCFVLARHFGFCFGVENAIEIAYKTLESHHGRRIFLLSEMIHNPRVNADLKKRGVQFIFETSGEQIIPWEELTADDIVIVPAFGTTLEIQEELAARRIDPYTYNTTCPFVEKVWNRSAELGADGYTVVIHGKATHEETRATFSHSIRSAPTLIVLNLEEAGVLADVICKRLDRKKFFERFTGKCSDRFDPDRDLERIGVVNQTTMLATETREIAKILRQAFVERYGEESIYDHFADTSDTLCYATNENQNATYSLIRRGANLVVVVGGYNSSNTSHIVELAQDSLPTYFIKDAQEILSPSCIRHFDLSSRRVITTDKWLLHKRPLEIAITCGASCPDAVVDDVILRILSFFDNVLPIEVVLEDYPLEAVTQP